MATITTSIDVGVPISVAYDQWTQFEEFPQFMSGVESVRQIDDTHVRWVAEVGGERHEWTAEIVEQEPDRVIAWRSVEGIPTAGRVEFEPVDDGTRVTVDMEYEPEGAKEKIGSLLGADERRVEDDLERFRELVEGRTTPTGGWRGSVESGEVVEDD
jgi:uncharacterized membrane protein